MKTKRKLNNKGFSLVELIVAVLIMGIVAGGAVVSFSTIYNARVDSASSMVTNIMKQARQKALALKNSTDTTKNETDVYAKFYVEGGDIYGEVEWIEECMEPDETGTLVPKKRTQMLVNEKICNTNIDMIFRNHDATKAVSIKVGDYSKNESNIYVYFKKSTGGIAKILTRQDTADDDLSAVAIDADEIFMKGDTKQATIVMVAATGRSYNYYE